jgi:alpha-glucosidase
MNEIEDQLRKAETRYKPSAQHVRFLNGHDNPRIASIARGDPKLGCSWASGCRDDQLPPAAYTEGYVYEKLRRALTVLYTLPGVPYLYQGDEVAFPGGGDPDMRRDMRFAEAELASLQMKKPGANVIALTNDQIALRDWVRKLGAARTASRAIRRGERKTLLGNEGDLWVYAYQTAPKEVAIVAVNRGGAVSQRTIGAGALDLGAISSFASPLGTGSLGKNGASVVLSLGAGEAAIFVAQ